MDRNKAHDVLHVWNGNRAQDCPVCNGTLTSDEEIVAAAREVAADNYYPRINPSLNNPLYCDENGNPIKKKDTPQTVKADEDGGGVEKKEPSPSKDDVTPKKKDGLLNVMTD